MYFHDVLLAIIAFVSELLGTLSGFGSSTFFVPAGSYFEKIQFVMVLTAILHSFSNISKIFLFRAEFAWTYFVKLAVPSVLLTALGAYLSAYFEAELLSRLLGVALIVISVLFLFGRLRMTTIPWSVAMGLSALSGLMTGLVGTGGAVRGVALAGLKLSPGAFVSLSSAIDMGGDFLRAGIYLWHGYMDWQQWFYVPLLGVAALAGARAGKYVLSRISQTQFEKVVAVFVFVAGISLLLPA